MEKTDVIFVKESDIRYGVFNHRYPFYPHPKGKTGYRIRVVAYVAKDLRMNHSTAQYL